MRSLPVAHLTRIALLSLIGIAAAAQGPGRQRVVVLGFDGVDHALAQRFMDAGELPNLRALAERGAFSRLETTNPAESAVSWATFGRGINPGRSGMFGFVGRRQGSYLPDLRFIDLDEKPASTFYGSRREPVTPLFAIAAGGGMLLGVLLGLLLRAKRGAALALGGALAAAGAGSAWWFNRETAPPNDTPVPTLSPVAEGETLFERLDEAGVRTKGFLVPMVTPVPELENGGLSGGLGVPDVAGNPIGAYFVLSTKRSDTPFSAVRKTSSGGLVLRLVEREDGALTASLPGPVDTARREAVTAEQAEIDAALGADGLDDTKRAELEARRQELRKEAAGGFASSVELVARRVDDDAVEVTVGGQSRSAKAGEWSNFQPVTFPLPEPLLASALMRFRVLEAGDEVRLFVPALGYDPRAVPHHMCIEHPPGYSRSIAEEAGLYDTTGWACMTNPLKDEIIDEDVFLEQIRLLTAERGRAILHELGEDDWDFYFAMLGETDRVQHLMFRLMDEEHPMYDAALAEKYGDAIVEAYRAMDRLVGQVVARCVDAEGARPTHLMVISDHGFTSFRRQVALNTWLMQEGYLVPRRGSSENALAQALRLPSAQQDYLLYMDPTRSRAFALGLGQIYINLQGREAEGTVSPDEYDALCAEITTKLLALRDPKDGAAAVAKVWRADELYSGPRVGEDADLIVGFAPYYRVSWSTTSGAFSREVFEDNDSKWSGDHASNDPDVVPGVLFSSRALADEQRPAIVDMAATVMALFGLPAAGTDGKPVQFR